MRCIAAAGEDLTACKCACGPGNPVSSPLQREKKHSGREKLRSSAGGVRCALGRTCSPASLVGDEQHVVVPGGGFRGGFRGVTGSTAEVCTDGEPTPAPPADPATSVSARCLLYTQTRARRAEISLPGPAIHRRASARAPSPVGLQGTTFTREGVRHTITGGLSYTGGQVIGFTGEDSNWSTGRASPSKNQKAPHLVRCWAAVHKSDRRPPARQRRVPGLKVARVAQLDAELARCAVLDLAARIRGADSTKSERGDQARTGCAIPTSTLRNLNTQFQ